MDPNKPNSNSTKKTGKKTAIIDGKIVQVDENQPPRRPQQPQAFQQQYNLRNNHRNNFENTQNNQNNQQNQQQQQNEVQERPVGIPYALIAVFFLLMEAILFQSKAVVAISALIIILVLTFFVWNKDGNFMGLMNNNNNNNNEKAKKD